MQIWAEPVHYSVGPFPSVCHKCVYHLTPPLISLPSPNLHRKKGCTADFILSRWVIISFFVNLPLFNLFFMANIYCWMNLIGEIIQFDGKEHVVLPLLPAHPGTLLSANSTDLTEYKVAGGQWNPSPVENMFWSPWAHEFSIVCSSYLDL